MTEKEAKRLRYIAYILDEQLLPIWASNHKHAWWLHWAAQEIRDVIIVGGKKAYDEEEYRDG